MTLKENKRRKEPNRGEGQVKAEGDRSSSATAKETPAAVRRWKILSQKQQRKRSPAAILISDFSLQKSERINFCCLNTRSVWQLIMAALGN